jgi:hypothetical protein
MLVSNKFFIDIDLTRQVLKLAEPGQNIWKIWIKPDERILQAGKGK